MPNDDEIAKELDISLEEYYQITDNLGPMFLYSLDSEEANQNPSYSTSESEMVDNQFEDYESEKLKQEMKTKLMKGIQSLPEKERIVISLYYYEQLNLKEIGVIIGVTESRVSQIHSSAIVKLRNMIELIN